MILDETLTADELDAYARKLLRHYRRSKLPRGRFTLRQFNRVRETRSRLAFGALLCVTAAEQMRADDVHHYGELEPGIQQWIAEQAEERARSLIPPRRTIPVNDTPPEAA